MKFLVDRQSRPLRQSNDKRLTGKMAIRIMAEEIGLEIGHKRLREFDAKVRRRVLTDHPFGANAQQWIDAMANVIVDDDDTKADIGFRRGIRRIRKLGGEA